MQNQGSSLKLTFNSGVVGFINGLWVVLAGTSYFGELSLYFRIFRGIFHLLPLQFIADAYGFLFRSGFQFILAPLLGVLFGAVVGWVTSRWNEESAKSTQMIHGAISGGIGGFLSLGIIYLNVYAS